MTQLALELMQIKVFRVKIIKLPGKQLRRGGLVVNTEHGSRSRLVVPNMADSSPLKKSSSTAPAI